MSPKPTIVFVPGGWHGPETWDKLVPLLQAQDFQTVSVDLPTTQTTSAGYSEDVQAVRQAVEAEIAKGQDVVLVAHSYGGAVAPSAIKGLAIPKASSQQSSSTGHVIGLVMIATGFLPTKVGFFEGAGGGVPPFMKVDEETGLSHLADELDPLDLFYHDLPKEEGEYRVSKLRNQSTKAFTDGTDSYAGWLDVPVWYIATVQDKPLPVFVQKMLVQMAKDAGADVRQVREIETGHSAMLVKPVEVVEVIVEAVGDFLKGGEVAV